MVFAAALAFFLLKAHKLSSEVVVYVGVEVLDWKLVHLPRGLAS